MSITTTITELKEHFIKWHNNNYDDLHARTKQYIDTKLNKIENDTRESNLNIINQVISTARALSKLIDGGHNINNISDITADLSNKNYDFEHNNLKALVTRISNNTDLINALNDKTRDYMSRAQIESLISSNGMKTIKINSGDNLNNYTVFGFYKCVSSSISNNINFGSAISNEIKGNPFTLIVIDANDDPNESNIKQILLIVKDGNDKNRILTRNCHQGNWTAWQELYGTHNTSELSMNVTFESTNQTATYTLLMVK